MSNLKVPLLFFYVCHLPGVYNEIKIRVSQSRTQLYHFINQLRVLAAVL